MLLINFGLHRRKRPIAVFLLSLFVLQGIPYRSFALTAGPSQPEFQSFSPIGSNDMVDLFTGNFSYNIPLMDVDGYPVNIGYHNVGNADEESSWVGLGWNVNLGEVNHEINGISDDYNGETIKRYMHVKPEEDWRVGLNLNTEVFGIHIEKSIEDVVKSTTGLSVGLNLGFYYGVNNYYGKYGGITLGTDLSINGKHGGITPGLNMDFSSNNGADIGVSCNYSYSNENQKKLISGKGITGSFGYNTRNGYNDLRITGNLRGGYGKDEDRGSPKRRTGLNPCGKTKMYSKFNSSASGTIPISLGTVNYVPTQTNKVISRAYNLGASIPGIKLMAGLFLTVKGTFAHSKTETEELAQDNGYGYLYLGNSTSKDLLDYTRDNAGLFNKRMPNLPLANLTYDNYSINAQGAAGEIRPYRNDIGVVHDPERIDTNSSDNIGIALELGFGTWGEYGIDVNYTTTKFESGPVPTNIQNLISPNLFFKNYDSANQKFHGLYEPYYFKSKGELSGNTDFYQNVGGHELYNGTIGFRNETTREPRAEMTYALPTSRVLDSTNDIGFIKKIEDCRDTLHVHPQGSSSDTVYHAKNYNNRAAHHLSEIVHVTTGGDRYVFGIPAMNNITKEVTMAVDDITNDNQTGICAPGSTINTATSGDGRDNLYTYSLTPAYAHSYLLSAILPSNYMDVTNDGISPDDIGNYIKFNYTLKNSDYRWRMPYPTSGNADPAFYEKGYHVDHGDNRASFTIGSKELWYVHSIESKNMIAEFYTSEKKDGKGVLTGIAASGGYESSASKKSTYKLDSIKLFNRYDRLKNGTSAIPIKTVYFEYDYSLCYGTLNSIDANGGKLTLKRIYFKYGNSDITLLNPYQFEYSDFNPDYNVATKNRWGGYQPINNATPNYMFPYINQSISKDSADKYVSAWQLTKIKLPTGGEIKVTYESDDYAFVQNRRADEMVQVLAMGSSSNYSSHTQRLYQDKDNVNDYLFIKKRGSNYYSTDLKNVYVGESGIVYFNYAVDVIGKNSSDEDAFEQVKGYAEVESVGVCPDDTSVVYLQIKRRKLDKSNLEISPITYAGINLARKDLPRYLYPGGDNPSFGQMMGAMLGSMKAMFQSLIMINPVKTMVKHNKAKNFDPSHSFVRICSPELKKRGGGSRVKRLELTDNWDKIVGGEPNSSYGNEYIYTTDSPYGTISSGVASYEPTTGGDENPFKEIKDYKIMKGSTFPRNEPIHESQFTPLGEQFYPAPVVGYSNVVVKSIHEPYAYSAQTVSQYQFYTAKDFPVQYRETKLFQNKTWKPYLVYNENSWYGWQSYSLIFNDMHGKPKKVATYSKKKPGLNSPASMVNCVEYFYDKECKGIIPPDGLDNTVSTLTYDRNSGTFDVQDKVLGEDVDVTIDSRYSRQRSFHVGVELNVNIEPIPPAPMVPIPSVIPSLSWDIKKFGSHVVTKIIQQYGIVRAVKTTTNSAVNLERNEVFNPETGEVLVKSYNNEYGDRLYQSSMPASWAYKGMSASYKNLFYNGSFDSIEVNSCKLGSVHLTVEQANTLCPGDEIMLTIASMAPFKVWLGDFVSEEVDLPTGGKARICSAQLYPRKPLSCAWSATTYHSIGFDVVRSGRKNQLTADVQNAVSMTSPIDGGSFDMTPANLLSLSANTFDAHNILSYYDTCSMNPFIVGKMGNYRPSNSYVYYKDRTYSTHNRDEGTFNIGSGDDFWASLAGECTYNLSPNGVGLNNWKAGFNDIKYLPWGTEAQNINALGITSSAQFGYNDQLPTSVASNAQHNTYFSDGFEDYNVFIKSNSYYDQAFNYRLSPFKRYPNANLTTYSSTPYSSIVANSSLFHLTSDYKHSGNYSLVTQTATNISIPVASSVPDYKNQTTFLLGQKYIVSLWAKGVYSPSVLNVSVNGGTVGFKKMTDSIDGWIKYDCSFQINSGSNVNINLPNGINFDDVRAFPSKSNIKAFVYGDENMRLMAVLDENNFASFYEYDKEGNLLRTKKETEKGIITIQESRSSTRKIN